jgi:tetratricopeptide (TPR) repeat protein
MTRCRHLLFLPLICSILHAETTAAGWTVRAGVAETKGNFGGAESAYRKAMDAATTPAEQMTTRANLLQFLTRFGRLDHQLAADLEQRLDDASPGALRAAASHCLGAFYMRAGKLDRGQAWLSRALALAESSESTAEDRWRIRNSAALALLAEGRQDAARAMLEQLLEEPQLPSETRLVLRANHAATLAAGGNWGLAVERMEAVLLDADHQQLSVEARWQVHELAAEVFDLCHARRQAKRLKSVVANLRQQVHRDSGVAHQVDYRSLAPPPSR